MARKLLGNTRSNVKSKKGNDPKLQIYLNTIRNCSIRFRAELIYANAFVLKTRYYTMSEKYDL